MKIPRICVPEGSNLDSKVKEMLNTDKSPKPMAGSLLKHYLRLKDTLENDLTAGSIGKKVEINYTKEDLTELSKSVIEHEKAREYFGSYLSALVNNIIKDNDEIILKPKMELNWIGAMLKKGTLIVEGNVGHHAGDSLNCGKLVIKGNTERYLGIGLRHGLIKVYGKAGYEIGLHSTGGEIDVYGKIKSIANSCDAWIYLDGKRIWPKK